MKRLRLRSVMINQTASSLWLREMADFGAKITTFAALASPSRLWQGVLGIWLSHTNQPSGFKFSYLVLDTALPDSRPSIHMIFFFSFFSLPFLGFLALCENVDSVPLTERQESRIFSVFGMRGWNRDVRRKDRDQEIRESVWCQMLARLLREGICLVRSWDLQNLKSKSAQRVD